jgi:hypothetical protein
MDLEELQRVLHTLQYMKDTNQRVPVQAKLDEMIDKVLEKIDKAIS